MTRAVDQAELLPAVRLSLTGDFQLLVEDRSVAVPHGVQRLLAFLAIARRPIQRSTVAGHLWPDVPEWRALGNLRTALWRLRRLPRAVVRTIDERLTLDPSLEVDLEELTKLSSEILAADDPLPLQRLVQLVDASNILPAWEDEWLVVERERFHELRVRALERACELLMARGDAFGAVRACLAAVEAEPFRDSAQRLLVRAHLTEGNHAAALRTYLAYRDLLQSELGLGPSELMEELMVGFATQHVRS